MRISVLSIFPETFAGFRQTPMIARAVDSGRLDIGFTDIRDYAEGSFRAVDDSPYGGGPGMVLRVDTVSKAITSVRTGKSRVVLLSPKGKPYDQKKAREFSTLEHLVLVCGHYEGFDARIETLATDKFSVGDFVMTGGELAAAAMADAVVRLLPGVLGGGPAATSSESFGADGLLEAPQYTHPPEFRGMKVPEVLLSGDHRRIEAWRKAESRRRTAELRPDLLAKGGRG